MVHKIRNTVTKYTKKVPRSLAIWAIQIKTTPLLSQWLKPKPHRITNASTDTENKQDVHTLGANVK